MGSVRRDARVHFFPMAASVPFPRVHLFVIAGSDSDVLSLALHDWTAATRSVVARQASGAWGSVRTRLGSHSVLILEEVTDRSLQAMYLRELYVDVLLLSLLDFLGATVRARSERSFDVGLEFDRADVQSLCVELTDQGVELHDCYAVGGWKRSPMTTVGVDRMVEWMNSLVLLRVVSICVQPRLCYGLRASPYLEGRVSLGSGAGPVSLLLNPVDPVTPIVFWVEGLARAARVAILAEVLIPHDDADGEGEWSPVPGWEGTSTDGEMIVEFRERVIVVQGLLESIEMDRPRVETDRPSGLGVCVTADARGRPVRLRLRGVGDSTCSVRVVACQTRSEYAGMFDMPDAMTPEALSARASEFWHELSEAVAPLVEQLGTDRTT